MTVTRLLGNFKTDLFFFSDTMSLFDDRDVGESQPKDSEMNYVTSLKGEIRDYLLENTKKNLNFLVLGCSSFLDKRWSTLSFLSDAKRREVKAKIMSELQQLELEWEGDLPPPPKKRKGLRMDIDGDSEELESGDTQAER